jgi:hypothetical protein
MSRGYAESPLKSETACLVTYLTGGTAYDPRTIEAGLAASTVPYSRTGAVIDCGSFSDLNSLYITINAQTTPAPIIMGQQWLLEDLNKPLYFKINGETQQILRLVKRKTGAVTSLTQTSVAPTYNTFYVPTFVNFDAISANCIFDAIYVARVG